MPVLITGGTSIDYDIQGKGPPLLLIGGLASDAGAGLNRFPRFHATFAS